jgi:hypothetical protein
MGRDPTDVNHSQIENGKEFGVNFFSELWLWPGVQVNHVLANDFMHCEVQGESQKHFLKVWIFNCFIYYLMYIIFLVFSTFG